MKFGMFCHEFCTVFAFILLISFRYTKTAIRNMQNLPFLSLKF
jgi:hypothetical protein